MDSRHHNKLGMTLGLVLVMLGILFYQHMDMMEAIQTLSREVKSCAGTYATDSGVIK